MNLKAQNKALKTQLEFTSGTEIFQDGSKTVKTERSTRQEGNTRIIEISEYHFEKVQPKPKPKDGSANGGETTKKQKSSTAKS